MIVHIKGIWHERLEDAPFIGALISATGCCFNCKDCFNQHIKNYDTIARESSEIIKDVLSNSLNQGIIFSGLEWTLQKDELLDLARCAKNNNLSTMLFTGREIFDKELIEIINSKLIDYIKCGKYKPELSCEGYFQYGIKLATSNQKIYKLGIDY